MRRASITAPTRSASRCRPRCASPKPVRTRASGSGLSGAAHDEHRANRGRVRNVRFLNIRVTGPRPRVSRLVGYDSEYPVENVLIRNLTVGGKTGAQAGGRGVRGTERAQRPI